MALLSMMMARRKHQAAALTCLLRKLLLQLASPRCERRSLPCARTWLRLHNFQGRAVGFRPRQRRPPSCGVSLNASVAFRTSTCRLLLTRLAVMLSRLTQRGRRAEAVHAWIVDARLKPKSSTHERQ